MHWFLLAALLLTTPALADTAADCLTLADRIDAKASKQQQPTPDEQATFDECLAAMSCEKSSKAEEAGKVPPDAQKSNKALLRFIGTTCGNLK